MTLAPQEKMSKSRRRLSLQLRIVPEPSIWRVHAKPKESPRLNIYDTHIELPHHKIVFAHLSDVELKTEGAVTFKADGKTYCYAVLNGTGEEISFADTSLLFNLLTRIKEGGIVAATEALSELSETRRSDRRLQLIGMTVMLILVLVGLLIMMFN